MDLWLVEAVRKAKRVYIVGNGGSYANAAHIANDLISVGIRAFTLDAATLTAFANDFGYENAFAHWLEKVGEEGDLLIALSGSGKSPNILNAINEADRIGMDVYRIFGNERGENMQEAEESQVKIGHELRACLKSS
ncbi:MAG TPA: SIS domain-containing protein [Candidatus Binatia bacterium]|nr:SIS domain-containing protein [Candidatus Binatia bacterium]